MVLQQKPKPLLRPVHVRQASRGQYDGIGMEITKPLYVRQSSWNLLQYEDKAMVNIATTTASKMLPRPVHVRQASINQYEGVGMEITKPLHVRQSSWNHLQYEDKAISDITTTVASKMVPRPVHVRQASVNHLDGIGMEITKPLHVVRQSSWNRQYEDKAMIDITTTVASKILSRPLHVRQASINQYEGVGMEITTNSNKFASWVESSLWVPEAVVEQDVKTNDDMSKRILNEPKENEKSTTSLITLGRSIVESYGCIDEARSLRVEEENSNTTTLNKRDDVDISLITCMGEDSPVKEQNDNIVLSHNIFSKEHLKKIPTLWDKSYTDKFVNGYSSTNDTPFRILGTSSCQSQQEQYVLTPPLMESLQEFFPFAKSSDNFWLKYSLTRDGACLETFLQHAKGVKESVLAIETVDGEVFGAFTSQTWKKQWDYFGNGETFLWRMRNSRRRWCHQNKSPLQQQHNNNRIYRRSFSGLVQMESEIDVFPSSGENEIYQICHHDKIAIGGGGEYFNDDDDKREDGEHINNIPQHHYGHGLYIHNDFLHGTTSPCITFLSPSLSKIKNNGSVFEIANLELWSLTPCVQEEDAKQLETSLLFMEEQMQSWTKKKKY